MRVLATGSKSKTLIASSADSMSSLGNSSARIFPANSGSIPLPATTGVPARYRRNIRRAARRLWLVKLRPDIVFSRDIETDLNFAPLYSLSCQRRCGRYDGRQRMAETPE